MDQSIQGVLYVVRVAPIALCMVLIALQVRMVRTHPRHIPTFGTYVFIGILTFLSAITVWWSFAPVALMVGAVFAILVPIGTAFVCQQRWQHLQQSQRV